MGCFERIRDTEQRIPYSFRLQPSSNRRVANSGGLHLLHHMRKSVTIARWNLLMFLRPRGPLWSFEASKFCYAYGSAGALEFFIACHNNNLLSNHADDT